MINLLKKIIAKPMNKPNLAKKNSFNKIMRSNKYWDFHGGLHLADMKLPPAHQIDKLDHSEFYYVNLTQHAGNQANLIVKIGDKVTQGQALTQGFNYSNLPVHAPVSGEVVAIAPYFSASASALPTPSVVIKASHETKEISEKSEKSVAVNWQQHTPQQLIEQIFNAGIAGLGGALFPSAKKINASFEKVKLLIINGVECEPYISCDDALMQVHSTEILLGIEILIHITQAENIIIAIEDNKPQAIRAMNFALKNNPNLQQLYQQNRIAIKVVPTKYPSGSAKQLIKILTNIDLKHNQRSISKGILMQNVATIFAIYDAVINKKPLIERVITLTGDKVVKKGNYWVPIGMKISDILAQVGYQQDPRLPVIMGGPMMGFELQQLDIPTTKLSNCIIAPDFFEYQQPKEELNCIRCGDCADVCPASLLPQQLLWYAKEQNSDKLQDYALFDCMECGLCDFVCPSQIPLVQYFRQAKAKINEEKLSKIKAQEAKERFNKRETRIELEKQARLERAQLAAIKRRQEVRAKSGIDPVAAAMERIKNKQKIQQSSTESSTVSHENLTVEQANADVIALRKARKEQRLREQQAATISEKTQKSVAVNHEKETDPRKATIAAAIARAKAKKAVSQDVKNDEVSGDIADNSSIVSEKTQKSVAVNHEKETDPRKAAIAAAIARAKEKKAVSQDVKNDEVSGDIKDNGSIISEKSQKSVAVNHEKETDPRKAAIAAAIARAKAKKEANKNMNTDKG